MTKQLRWIPLSQVIPAVLGLLGGLAYLLVAYGHAHGQVSVIDEGLYLYKGYLFTKGDYRPFQDFGPLTNHMPLSFLIPGWIQWAFGSGIRTGRYFAIFLGLFMLLGLWLVTKRLAGRWWAVMAIWAVVVNPALLKIYSQATSQVLVACMLIWVLVLVVGNERKTWQILLGAILSGLLFMTRINMAPVLFLVIAYVFLNSGRRTGILTAVAGLAVVIIGHAIYWPEILKIWAKWIPVSITPFLDAYRLPSDAIPFWDPVPGLGSRINSLRAGLKLHLVSTIGFLGMLLALIVRRKYAGLHSTRRTAWFLVSLYGVLVLFHAAASLGLNYCVYCFRPYLAFFSPVGLILFALLGKEIGHFRNRPIAGVLLIIIALIPYMFGLPPLSEQSESLLFTHVPRVKSLSLLPGTIKLHVLLGNRLGWDFDDLRITGTAILWLFMILIPLIIQIASHLFERSKQSDKPSANFLLGITAFLVLQMSITSIVFGNSYRDYDCGEDVIAANEDVGAYLRDRIPENSDIYWGVGRSPIPMLYLPNRETYPPQLNGDYTFMLQGDSQELLRFGYWNHAVAKTLLWMADYVLFDVRSYPYAGAVGFVEDQYDEINRSSLTNPCNIDSAIMIFKRE
jgi:hypothetical protein